MISLLLLQNLFVFPYRMHYTKGGEKEINGNKPFWG